MASVNIDPDRYQAVLFDASLFDAGFFDSDGGILGFHATGSSRNKPEDAVGVRGVGSFRDTVAGGDVQVLDGALSLIESLRRYDIRTAVVTVSRNRARVLDHAGGASLFDVRVDASAGRDLARPGKPAPAAFLEAARRLGADPSRCVVVEDAQSGVCTTRWDGFALVVGVDRTGRTDARTGADLVVAGFSDITVSRAAATGQRRLSSVPDPLTHWEELAARIRTRRPVLVFDFDGTLAPIEDDPAGVALPPNNRQVLQDLAEHCPVAILSGRDLSDVRERVDVNGLWYSGSHGFEVVGPSGELTVHHAGEPALPELDEAQRRLSSELESVPGVLIDRKRFALAVHYRHVDPAAVDHVLSCVDHFGQMSSALKTTHGRLVVELLPEVEWNKGQALLWLLAQLGLGDADAVPVYAGDDITDEDALHAIHDQGVGIVVLSSEHGDRLTWAHYAVDSPNSLSILLSRIAFLLRTPHEMSNERKN